jgi:glucose-6-phosphate 1-dehydrogenase
VISRLAIFGATGDLTARYLLPGLAALRAAGHLGDGFILTGAARHGLDSAEFQRWAAAQLGRHAGHLPTSARQAIVSAARYQQADVTDPASVAAVIAGDEPLAVYLALPPAVFPAAVTAIHEAGLPPDSRIVLEKPFGEDLDSAIELNRLLAETVPEQAVFRVDHFLAMTTVQNVLGTRLANRVLEPIWDAAHIAEVDIVWEESLALEGRAGYYDGAGALKDMLQNHLLQLLCLVAMEPPISLSERDLRDRKMDVLRSVRPLTDADVTRRTRRARYAAGRIGDRQVPAYVDEEGVDPARRDLRRGGTRAGKLALAGYDLPAAHRQGAPAGPQGGGGALPARAAPALRPYGRGTPQRAAVRARAGNPDPWSDWHRGTCRNPRAANPDHPARPPRTARLWPSAARRAERERRPVHPRR